MADVARLRRDDRGQLFLVAALALAVIFVTLAVLLNTAIYTGNIATRDPGPGTGEVVEYQQAAVSMADQTLADVNRGNNSSYTELESTFRDAVTVWSNTRNVHASATLADAHLSTVATLRGTKIEQDTNRTFTSNNSSTWHVANDSAVRAFSMTVNQSSLADDGLFQNESEFAVEFEGGGTALTLYVYDNGTLTNDVTVSLYDDANNEIGSCSVAAGSDDRVEVDLSAATLAGQDCAALAALDDRLPSHYNTSFMAGGNAKGTYVLVVDRPVGELETGADDAAGGPYVTPALYSAELQVTYRNSVTYYRTELRVAPGEIHA